MHGSGDGGNIDIHKLIGKIPHPKDGWTPGDYKYLGPYNPLESQLEHDDKGNITKFHVKPKINLIILQLNMMFIIQLDKIKMIVIEKWFQRLMQCLMVSYQKWYVYKIANKY